MKERLGEYRLRLRLGRGGMGAVYLAEDETGQQVALKVLEEGASEEETAVARFEQERRLLKRLRHPRIVGARGGVQQAAGCHYYAMEYVAGRNLSQLLRAVGRLEPREALRIVGQALEGLEAAHAIGVVHRDLKASNVLLDAKNQVKLCDFGLARDVDRTRLTLSGQTLGTPATMSPEQARGEPGGPRSDLYSLGVLLYELLTGQLPFQGDSPLAVLRMHLDVEPRAPSGLRAELPPELDRLVLKALAKRPSQRFASAAEMRAAVSRLRFRLEAGRAGRREPRPEATQALAPGNPTTREGQERSTRLRPATVAVAGAVALLAVGWGLLGGGSGPTASDPAAPETVRPALQAQPAPSPQPQAQALSLAHVTLRTGQVLEGQVIELKGGRLVLRQAGGAQAEIPWDLVQEVAYTSTPGG